MAYLKTPFPSIFPSLCVLLEDVLLNVHVHTNTHSLSVAFTLTVWRTKHTNSLPDKAMLSLKCFFNPWQAANICSLMLHLEKKDIFSVILCAFKLKKSWAHTIILAASVGLLLHYLSCVCSFADPFNPLLEPSFSFLAWTPSWKVPLNFRFPLLSISSWS